MSSAPAHRVDAERVQFTVAELLGRYGAGALGRADITSVPKGWPTSAASPRRRLVAAAGALVAVSSMVGGAALFAHQPHGGPMGTEAAEGGHPEEGRPGSTTQAAPAVPRPVIAAPVARTTRVTPASRPAVRRSTPAAVSPRRHRVSDEDRARTPSGSALSRLTAAIGPVELTVPLDALAPLDSLRAVDSLYAVDSVKSLLGGLG